MAIDSVPARAGLAIATTHMAGIARPLIEWVPASIAALIAVATLALAPVGGASAQSPATEKQSLRIVVGFPPGGSADVIARILADAMRDDFTSVIVENKAGASGRIAVSMVKHAAPDGRTLLLTPSGPMVVSPHVYRKLDYDPVKDFTPISLVTRFQFGLVSGPSTAVSSMKELIAKAKSDSANATFASPGNGTVPHFLGVMLAETAGVSLTHVPFQGGAPANNALLGGHVGYKLDVVSETAAFHKAGKLRIVAVTGAVRDPQVPEVPTLKEQGIDMEATAFFALYGPAGIPAASARQLQQSVARAVKQAGVAQRLGGLGYEVIGSTGDELAKTQKADLARWEKPIKSTGFRLD